MVHKRQWSEAILSFFFLCLLFILSSNTVSLPSLHVYNILHPKVSFESSSIHSWKHQVEESLFTCSPNIYKIHDTLVIEKQRKGQIHLRGVSDVYIHMINCGGREGEVNVPDNLMTRLRSEASEWETQTMRRTESKQHHNVLRANSKNARWILCEQNFPVWVLRAISSHRLEVFFFVNNRIDAVT